MNSFIFLKKFYLKKNTKSLFVLGITQVVVFIAFTSSSREATSCLQSKLRAGLSAHTFPLGNPASLPTPPASACTPRLCPLSFGEGVEFDPLPPTEVRYTSSVKYDSERHFIDDVHLPLGLAMASCSQTVTCIPNCTWRNYKAELRFEPRHKATRFLSTTIVYPKFPKTVYTTTLDYNCRKTLRRFLSSVELEATEFLGSDYLSDEC
ncbi:refilin-B isoform X2 [Rhinolophus sinicus]|uniref:refilin-B isoform X2 n=1 Tax=Rhinolophus sinicus TaxID=89399 RepID=UPI003D796BF6